MIAADNNHLVANMELGDIGDKTELIVRFGKACKGKAKT